MSQVGFTYVLVEHPQTEFFKVGKGVAQSANLLLESARGRLGKLQSCNVRPLRFTFLFQFQSRDAAEAAERAWHARWRAKAGLNVYSAQESYHWSKGAISSCTPSTVKEFMSRQQGFIRERPEANVFSEPGGYVGPPDGKARDGRIRQMRLHILELVDEGASYYHLYGTSAPNELATYPEADIATWWWTGNPRHATKPLVFERNAFDPKRSQDELGMAIENLRQRFSERFAASALPRKNAPFALTWFKSSRDEVVEAIRRALGPSWNVGVRSVQWSAPIFP